MLIRVPGLRAPLNRGHFAVACRRLGDWIVPSPISAHQVQPRRLDELELIEAESLGLTFWGVRGDFTGHYLTHGVVYEDNVLTPLLEDAKRAKTVVDVGSNIGLIALPVARALLPGGRVHCLDLSQRNCRLLRANAHRNGIENIDVYPTGAGDVLAGFAVATRQGSTLQAISAVASDYLNAVEMSMTVPLDTLFADGEKIDILKIDTDGYEYRVLRGAERLLHEHKPIVYLEYSDRASMDQLNVPGVRMLELLEAHGYQPTILHRREPPQPIAAGPEMIETVSRVYQRDWDSGITHLDIRWHVPQ